MHHACCFHSGYRKYFSSLGLFTIFVIATNAAKYGHFHYQYNTYLTMMACTPLSADGPCLAKLRFSLPRENVI